MNRWNKYTQRLNYEGHTILFQIETDEVLLLTEELSKLVQKYSNNPDGIADVHPELFKKIIVTPIRRYTPINIVCSCNAKCTNNCGCTNTQKPSGTSSSSKGMNFFQFF